MMVYYYIALILSITQALKAPGNAVVAQQAAYALRLMLEG